MLFREFPEFDEGRSRRRRRRSSRPRRWRGQAERLGLGDHLLLGRGEEKTGGRRKQALLADGYEALIAAIYLDGGIEPARAFIVREFAPLIADIRRHGCRARTTSRRCRSYCSRDDSRCPSTASSARSGPDHHKQFQVEVVVRGEALAAATGPSKKEAEQESRPPRAQPPPTTNGSDHQISLITDHLIAQSLITIGYE